MLLFWLLSRKNNCFFFFFSIDPVPQANGHINTFAEDIVSAFY